MITCTWRHQTGSFAPTMLTTWFITYFHMVTFLLGSKRKKMLMPCLNNRPLSPCNTERKSEWTGIYRLQCEKTPSDICSQRTLRSACTSVQSDQSLLVCMKQLCILGYSKCTQWRFWSDCKCKAYLNRCCSCICPKVGLLKLQPIYLILAVLNKLTLKLPNTTIVICFVICLWF